jgi:excinuclease UvrABC nuclease subunit
MDPEANIFDEKIKGIQKIFFSALDDFKKYYVYYNKNPEVDEYQNFFATSKGQLQELNSDIFLITNNIQKNIKDLSTEMAEISNNLNYEKKLNAELLSLINNIQTTEDGSAIMIDDVKDEYNMQYYKNWELFIGIIFFTGMSIKMFNKSSNSL